MVLPHPLLHFINAFFVAAAAVLQYSPCTQALVQARQVLLSLSYNPTLLPSFYFEQSQKNAQVCLELCL